MAQSKADKQFEEAVGALFKLLWKVIVWFFVSLFKGLKKLGKWQAWVGLFLSVLITLGTRYIWREKIFALEVSQYTVWLIYCALLAAPVLYLLVIGGIGNQKTDEYEKLYRDIGFVGKNGKCPAFSGARMDGKKKILTFRSYIPLAEWQSARAKLETALDCNIIKMEHGKSKRLVVLTTLPSDFELSRNIPWSDSYCSNKNGVLTIGQSALGNVSFDLNKIPHVLAAGETGSGKSVILRTMLRQMVLQGSKVFMIDFKGGVEFGKQYERFGEVITDRNRALEVLEMLVRENEYRLKIFRDLEVKNLAEYNRKTKQNLCRIGLFTDEIAEMLDKKGVSKEERKIYEALEGKLSTLARLSRATGINLFLGVQRPDANVLTGQIKNNIPVRISGRFADKAASEIVLGNTDAVNLPDIKGRFLYKVGNDTVVFQAFYFDDDTMLHDVDVEVGSMLTEAPVYTPGKVSKPQMWEEENSEKPAKKWRKLFEGKKEPSKKEEKPRKVKTKAEKVKNKAKKAQINCAQEEVYQDAEVYQDVEEELPFGDPAEVDDYDFDFFRDYESSRKGEE